MIKIFKNIIKKFIIVLSIFVLLNPINVQATNMNDVMSEMEKQALQMFNQQFTPYLGQNITAQKAKSLISIILASNGNNSDHKVWINYEGNVTSISEIKSSEHYNASVISYNEGYINIISLELSSNSGTTIVPNPNSTPTASPTSSTTIVSSPKVTESPQTSQPKLPQTGIENYTKLFILVILLIISSILLYKKINKYSNL